MKLKLKIIWDSKITKVILAVLFILAIVSAIILPSTLNARKPGQLIAFNRDATSGTREAFIEKVLNENPNKFTPSKNVLEASNNESMIKSVIKNKYSLAYASAGTVAELKQDSLTIKNNYKGKINVAGFEGVMPNLNTINEGTYTPQRNFNAFFRVDKESEDSKIFNWQKENVKNLNDNLKASYAFYYWFQFSNEAAKIINKGSEIAHYPESGRFEISWENLDYYIKKTNIKSNNIRIEIVGSSSAQSTMKDLTEHAEKKLLEHYNNLNLQFIIATNGSGDAFKKIVPGTTGADYIGIQSREPKSSELESWGWEYSDSNLINFYMPFAIDAILIIYNISHLNDKEKDFYINREDINNLYTKNDIFLFDNFFRTKNGKTVSLGGEN